MDWDLTALWIIHPPVMIISTEFGKINGRTSNHGLTKFKQIKLQTTHITCWNLCCTKTVARLDISAISTFRKPYSTTLLSVNNRNLSSSTQIHITPENFDIFSGYQAAVQIAYQVLSGFIKLLSRLHIKWKTLKLSWLNLKHIQLKLPKKLKKQTTAINKQWNHYIKTEKSHHQNESQIFK